MENLIRGTVDIWGRLEGPPGIRGKPLRPLPHELPPSLAAVLADQQLHVLGHCHQVIPVLRVCREMDQGAVEVLCAGHDLSLPGRLVEGDQSLAMAEGIERAVGQDLDHGGRALLLAFEGLGPGLALVS